MGRIGRIRRVNRAVFLDRDGVLNESFVMNGKPCPPPDLSQFRLLPGVKGSTFRLKERGFKLIVVTNQPDVRTGKQNLAIVEAMHEKLRHWLPLDDIRACYHIDEDRCKCRKPKPEMLISAARDWNIELHDSFMIGDRWRDIDAGHAAGCKTVFIDYRYQETRQINADFSVRSLADALPYII